MDFQPAQQNSISVWWHLPQQKALILDNFPPAEGQIDMFSLIPCDERIFMNDRTSEFSRSLFSLLTIIGRNTEVIEKIDSLKEKKEYLDFKIKVLLRNVLECEFVRLQATGEKQNDFNDVVNREKFTKILKHVSTDNVTRQLLRHSRSERSTSTSDLKYLDYIYEIMTHRLSMTTVDALLASRVGPALSNDFNWNGTDFNTATALRVNVYDDKDEIITQPTQEQVIQQILKFSYVNDLVTYISNLPISCVECYDYPPVSDGPDGEFRRVMQQFKETFTVEYATPETFNQPATFVKNGVNFRKNFPFVLFGKIYHCEEQFLPPKVKCNPRLFHLEGNLYLLPTENYRSIGRLPRKRDKSLSTLYSPETGEGHKLLRKVGIVLTTTFLESGMELALPATKPLSTDEDAQVWNDDSMKSALEIAKVDAGKYQRQKFKKLSEQTTAISDPNPSSVLGKREHGIPTPQYVPTLSQKSSPARKYPKNTRSSDTVIPTDNSNGDEEVQDVEEQPINGKRVGNRGASNGDEGAIVEVVGALPKRKAKITRSSNTVIPTDNSNVIPTNNSNGDEEVQEEQAINRKRVGNRGASNGDEGAIVEVVGALPPRKSKRGASDSNEEVQGAVEQVILQKCGGHNDDSVFPEVSVVVKSSSHQLLPEMDWEKLSYAIPVYLDESDTCFIGIPNVSCQRMMPHFGRGKYDAISQLLKAADNRKDSIPLADFQKCIDNFGELVASTKCIVEEIFKVLFEKLFRLRMRNEDVFVTLCHTTTKIDGILSGSLDTPSPGWQFAGNPYDVNGFVIVMPLCDDCVMYYSDGSSKLWEVLQMTRKAMYSSDDDAITAVCEREDFGAIEMVTLECLVPVILKNTAVVLFGGNQILLKAYAKCGEYEQKIDTNFSSSFPKPLSCYFNAIREGTLAWKFVRIFFTRLSESNIPEFKNLSTTFIQRIHNDMPTALTEFITEDHKNTAALISQLESEKKRMSMNSPRITKFKVDIDDGPENFTHEDFSSENSGQQGSPRIPRRKIDFVEDVSGRCGIAEVTLREYLQKQKCDVDLSDDIELEKAIVHTIHDMNCIFIRENDEFGLKFNDKLDTKDKIHVFHYASDSNNGDSGPDINSGPNIDNSGPDISGDVGESAIDYAKIAGKGQHIEVRLSPTNVARKSCCTTLEDECREISGLSDVSNKNNAITKYAQKLLSSENVGYNIQVSLTAAQNNSSLIASDGMCGLHSYFWACFTSIGAYKIAAEWAYNSVHGKHRVHGKHKSLFLKRLSDLLEKAAFLEDILGFLISKGKGKCVSAEDINNILISSTKFGEDPLFMSYFSTQFLSVSSLTTAVEDLEGLIKKLKTYENFITTSIPRTLARDDWLSDTDMTMLFLIGNVKAILYAPLSGHYCILN